MAKVTITDANSVKTLDNKIYLFTGNTAIPAGKVKVTRKDGTGSSLVSASIFTKGDEKYLILYIGDSHLAGSTALPPQAQYNDLLVNASQSFISYSQSDHNYAVGGIKVQELAGATFPNMLAYVNANKSLYTGVIAVVGGGTNDCTYGALVQIPDVYKAKRYLSMQLAKAGCKVVLLTMPPDIRFDSTHGNPWPEQYSIMQEMRKQIDADTTNNFRLEYGAARVTNQHLQDQQLYLETSPAANPTLFATDGIHYSELGYKLLGRRHIVPAIIEAIAYTPPARLAPTNLVINPTDKTLSITKTVLDPLPLHEYTLDGGTTWKPLVLNSYGIVPIAIPDGSYATGSIKVRVCAYGGGVAGPSISSTQPYTVGTVSYWKNVVYSPTNRANMQITDNNALVIQDFNYRFESVAYESRTLPGTGKIGFSVVYDTSLQYFAFCGLVNGSETPYTTPPVRFPIYGIKVNPQEGSWGPSSGDSTNANFPAVNGDILTMYRDGTSLVYYQNDVEKYRLNTFTLENEVRFLSMGSYPGSGINGAKLYSEQDLLNK